MQTSDPDIYAGGDVVVVRNLISGDLSYLPLGSMANRQGRVIGTNLAGGQATFEGVVGSWCVKLNKMYASGAGLTLHQARLAGFDAIEVSMEGSDKAHFYPGHTNTSINVVVDKQTRRVLAELSPVDREILELRHFEELGNNECAAVLGIAPKAASIRYVRALKRLRELLESLSLF